MIGLAAVVALEALAGVLLWSAWRRVTRVQRVVALIQVGWAEADILREARRRLREQQESFEQVIGTGTDSIEAVHRAIADLSFDLWGRQAGRARTRHDRVADQIYGTARAINRGASGLLRAWLSDNRRDRDEEK